MYIYYLISGACYHARSIYVFPTAQLNYQASKTRENPPISILKHNQSLEVAKKKPLNGDNVDPLMVSAMPQCKRVSTIPRGACAKDDNLGSGNHEKLTLPPDALLTKVLVLSIMHIHQYRHKCFSIVNAN
jgi:hypothetical protein